MTRSLAILSLLCALGMACMALVAPKHPFHTSIGDCHYNGKNHRLEISIRFFTDDFEQAISKQAGKPIVLNDQRTAEPELIKYINDRFGLTKSGRQISFKVLGKELSHDVTWVYIESDTTNGRDLIFKHAAITEVFDDQQNLLNLHGPAGKKTLMFNRKQTVVGW